MRLPSHPDSGDPWAGGPEIPVVTVSLLEVGVHRLRLEHALDHAHHSVVRALGSRDSHQSPGLCVCRVRWRDTLPWAPQGNISQCGCPSLLASLALPFAGGGPFRSKVHPLLLVRIVWSPTCEILACTWGWCKVPVTAACGHCLAQCPSCPHE